MVTVIAAARLMKGVAPSGWPLALAIAVAMAWTRPACAGPPFLSDDPAPTDHGHYEIYVFGNGTFAQDGVDGAAGVDFNYGAAKDLQLTAVFPVSYERPDEGQASQGFGNVELAAKFRFLHQESAGWDVAVFPRAFLPSGSSRGDQHASFLLPVWIGRDMGAWSTFGGAGYVINPGGDSKDYWLAGWALTRRLGEAWLLGTELYHQTADTEAGSASTVLGLGSTWDANAHVHLLGYAGAGLQNAAETGRAVAYASILFTF